jgi:hypothetical protein
MPTPTDKEAVVRDGEWCRRHVVCHNPKGAVRQGQQRLRVPEEIEAGLASLSQCAGDQEHSAAGEVADSPDVLRYRTDVPVRPEKTGQVFLRHDYVCGRGSGICKIPPKTRDGSAPIHDDRSQCLSEEVQLSSLRHIPLDGCHEGFE